MVLRGPSARCQGDRGACVLMCTLMTDSGCLPEALICANEEIHGRHCHSPSVMSEQSGEWTGVGTKAAIKCRVYRPASAQFWPHSVHFGLALVMPPSQSLKEESGKRVSDDL